MEMDHAVDQTADTRVRPEPPCWIRQHPKYIELLRLEVNDSAQVLAAFLVYMDLTEVRQWTSVSSFTCPELDAVLFLGRVKEGGKEQVILPLPVHRTLSHQEIQCALLSRQCTSVLLCAVASDSTLVYQRLTQGLVTPDPPVDIKDMGRRQHRKRRLSP